MSASSLLRNVNVFLSYLVILVTLILNCGSQIHDGDCGLVDLSLGTCSSSSHRTLFEANSAEICRHFNKFITLPSVLLSCVFNFHLFFLQISLLLSDSWVSLMSPAILKNHSVAVLHCLLKTHYWDRVVFRNGGRKSLTQESEGNRDICRRTCGKKDTRQHGKVSKVINLLKFRHLSALSAWINVRSCFPTWELICVDLKFDRK